MKRFGKEKENSGERKKERKCRKRKE